MGLIFTVGEDAAVERLRDPALGLPGQTPQYITAAEADVQIRALSGPLDDLTIPKTPFVMVRTQSIAFVNGTGVTSHLNRDADAVLDIWAMHKTRRGEQDIDGVMAVAQQIDSILNAAKLQVSASPFLTGYFETATIGFDEYEEIPVARINVLVRYQQDLA